MVLVSDERRSGRNFLAEAGGWLVLGALIGVFTGAVTVVDFVDDGVVQSWHVPVFGLAAVLGCISMRHISLERHKRQGG